MHAMAVSLKLIFQEVNLMFNCLQIVVSLDCIFKCNTFNYYGAAIKINNQFICFKCDIIVS